MTAYRLRYLLPNAITCLGIAFAAIAIQRAVEGEYRTAAWWAMYCLLTDNIDGAVARRLRASSAFSGQLDSFADFFSFGVAPAVVLYAFFTHTPSAGWSDPIHHTILSLLVLLFLICVAARLARFNVSAPQGQRFFVGWPTTYVGGMLMATFAVALKYGDPAWTAVDRSSDSWLVLGDTRLDELMRALPWLLLPLSFALVSQLRMPRAAPTRKLGLDLLLGATMVFGYSCGLARRLPEYLVAGGVIYMLISLRYHRFTRAAGGGLLTTLFPED